MTNPLESTDASSLEGVPRRLRRDYALAAVDALRDYIASGLRFALRTVGPGERLAPSRTSMRLVFTLPSWDAYISRLRGRPDGAGEGNKPS